MVRFLRRFDWFLVLVLCSAAPSFCEEYFSTPNATTSVSRPKAPPVFPQNATSKAKILVSETLQNTLNLTNTSDPKQDNVNKNQTNTNSSKTDNVSVNASKTQSKNDENDAPIQSTNKTNGSVDVSTSQSQNSETNVPVQSTIAPSNITENRNNTGVDASRIDTEVGDMLNATGSYTNPIHIHSVPLNSSNTSQGISKETELIDDGQNTEDVLRNSSTYEDQVDGPGVPLLQGQLAAILAGVFVGISIIAYLGLLSWRRYLENRYGNRQMLVNEDEFNDDLTHFSI